MARKLGSLPLCRQHRWVMILGMVLEESVLRPKSIIVISLPGPQGQSGLTGLKTSLGSSRNGFPDSRFLTSPSSVIANSGPQLGNGKIQNLVASKGCVLANIHQMGLRVSQNEYISIRIWVFSLITWLSSQSALCSVVAETRSSVWSQRQRKWQGRQNGGT